MLLPCQTILYIGIFSMHPVKCHTLTSNCTQLNKANQLEDDIHQRGFHIIDNFLSEHSYQTLLTTIATKHGLGQFRNAKVGRNKQAAHHVDIRSDQIYWLDGATYQQELRAYFTAIEAIRNTLNQAFFLGLVDYEAHFAAYCPGSFYKKHVDQFTTTKNRIISCVYYLNSTWFSTYGGELSIYDPEDNLLAKIQPIGNRLVCFNSLLPHEVHPANHIRYSITGWLKTRSQTLF